MGIELRCSSLCCGACMAYQLCMRRRTGGIKEALGLLHMHKRLCLLQPAANATDQHPSYKQLRKPLPH